ncbi:MAG: TIGR00730 family Rossman fold protein [Proteobacteria bacterium]|nr:TIGR00730 family Rossman fold protein [Pseudomonadota bacterium]
MTVKASIGLFCSASDALPDNTKWLARQFGERCANNNYRLVYGGGSRGLMGEASRAAFAAGGKLHGVIPASLMKREQARGASIGEIEVVDTLSERKSRMAAESDAFVALPGGVGTLDELFEMITWNDLGLHDKPVILCDEGGFWEPLLAWFAGANAAGVIRPGAVRRFHSVASLDELFALLETELQSGHTATT